MGAAYWIVSILLVISFWAAIGYLVYFYISKTRKELHGKINGVVDKINNSNMYTYSFDKQQENNIKNLETNMNNMLNNYSILKNDLMNTKGTILKKSDLSKKVETEKLITKDMNIDGFSLSRFAPNDDGNKGDAKGDNWLYMYNGGIFDGGLGVKYIKSTEIDTKRATTQELTVTGDAQFNQSVKMGKVWDMQVDDAGKLKLVADNDVTKHVFFDKTGYVGALTGGVSTRGGQSKHNPSQFGTHFPAPIDGKNYIRGDTNVTGDIDLVGQINITRKDPGPMIERNDGEDANRFGVGQFAGGKLRVYGSSVTGSSVNLSLAKGKGTFDDIVEVKADKTVNVNGPVSFNGGVCIGSTCLREVKGALQACNTSYTTCKNISVS